MDNNQKLSLVKTILDISGTDEDSCLTAYLEMAKSEILSWRYGLVPLEERPTEVQPDNEMVQIYAVVAGYSIRGAENEVTHSEDGISRSFRYSDMIAYIRASITPICKLG